MNINNLKVIFFSFDVINNLNESGIYHDLLREFQKRGNEITIISPKRKKSEIKSYYQNKGKVSYINVPQIKIKAAFIEKFVSIILYQYLAIFYLKRYMKNLEYDLIIVTTPPIFSTALISFLHSKNKKLSSYLLLKDIFPQNGIDLNLYKRKSIFYRLMKKQEINLYRKVGKIGCMSPLNLSYIQGYGLPEISKKLEVNYNSIDPDLILTNRIHNVNVEDEKIRFVFGGNLGKPQGLSYLIDNISLCQFIEKAHFFICGSGTEYNLIKRRIENDKIKNLTVITELNKKEYESFLLDCHVGLVSLDPRFTIPNFPSRILPYMKYKLPLLYLGNNASDMGDIISRNSLGFSCDPSDSKTFIGIVQKLTDDHELRLKLGKNSNVFLRSKYTSLKSYELIIKSFKN